MRDEPRNWLAQHGNEFVVTRKFLMGGFRKGHMQRYAADIVKQVIQQHLLAQRGDIDQHLRTVTAAGDDFKRAKAFLGFDGDLAQHIPFSQGARY